MSWQTTMTTILRHTINDVDDPQTYTDSRLQLALLIGANFVNTELNWVNSYQVNIEQLSISPDPTSGAINDNWFINLTVMKTTIFMLTNDLAVAARSGFSMKDIDVTIDFREMYKARKLILDEMNKIYEQAKVQYQIGVYSAGQAILGPINCLAGNYRGTNAYWGPSERSRSIW
jgi:hypothetical protein